MDAIFYILELGYRAKSDKRRGKNLSNDVSHVHICFEAHVPKVRFVGQGDRILNDHPM